MLIILQFKYSFRTTLILSLTSPEATELPGINNSGYTLSIYHLNDLQPNVSRRAFLPLTSPKSP